MQSAIQHKVQEIKQTPLKLRRQVNGFPYFYTLQKALTGIPLSDLTEDERRAIESLVRNNIYGHK